MEFRDWTTAVATGETATLELKTSLSDSRKIVETIAAMATIGGGDILVGVRPDGRPVGVRLGEGALERFVQRVQAQTDPRVYIDVALFDLGDVPVLHIRVPPGDGPHLAFGRAFYRSGPATVSMSRDEYERRLLDRMRESSGYERRTDLGTTFADVDAGKVDRFLERAGAAGARLEGPWQAALRRLFLARSDALTVAGVLLFGREPQGPLPQATIRARAIRGAAEDAIVADGPLFEQIETAAAFVSRNLRVELRRDDVPELPPAAVREVVTNAVAHRDYRSTAPIQPRLDDRGPSVLGHHLRAGREGAARRPPPMPSSTRVARHRRGRIPQEGVCRRSCHGHDLSFQHDPLCSLRSLSPRDRRCRTINPLLRRSISPSAPHQRRGG